MKNIFFIVVFSLFFFICAAQDCASVYTSAVQDYNKGNYAEAQRKFLIVAQNCGDYSDVYKNLKNCNTKLTEKLTQLDNDNKKLKAENATLKESNNSHVNNQQIIEINRKLKFLEEKNDRQRGEIAKLKKEKSELEQKIGQKETNVTTDNPNHEDVNVVKEQVDIAKSHAEKIYESLSSQKKLKRKDLKKLKEEVKLHKDQLDKLINLIMKLEK